MLRLKRVSFTYSQGAKGAGVENVDLSVAPGEVVLVTGESGCGKTTVTRLANGLCPQYYEGKVEGTVLVDSLCVPRAELHETSRLVGSVFQNPKSQFYTMDTDSELAFGSENQGLPEQEIRSRVAKAVDTFGISSLLNRSVASLSGGERQKIACAAVSVPKPPLIVLDEPSSNLDTEAIEEIRRVVAEWKREGAAVLVAEHRLYYLADLVDRVYLMSGGKVVRAYSGDEFRALAPERIEDLGLRPLRFEDALTSRPKASVATGAEFLELSGFTLWRGHRGCKRKTLDIDHLRIRRGSTIAVIGRNGAGKTTFSRCLAGLEKKCRGEVEFSGRRYKGRDRLSLCYMVMQDVNHQLFTESVLDEILLSMEEEDEKRAMDILESLDLARFSNAHPMSLSGGQKQRVAIASALASGREVVLYDEPTSGLDLKHMREVSSCMGKLHDDGVTQIVVTHDPEFILSCCDHALLIEDGRVADLYELDDEGSKKLLGFFLSV